jgi:uncharacterized protein (DUF736 family)
VCPVAQKSQEMTAKKTLSNFATATNDEKRKDQHRIRQFFSSLLDDPGLNLAKRLFHKPDQEAQVQLWNRIRQILQSNSSINTIKP